MRTDVLQNLTLCRLWDGIQGLYRIHRPREWDVYNLTTTFHPVSTFPEGTRLPKIPCRCMPVWRGKWWKLMNFPWKWNSVNPNLFHRVTPSLFQQKCMDLKKLDINLKQINLQYYITYITYITYIAEKRSKNKRRPPWQLLSKWNGSGDHRDQSCIGLRYKTQINVLHAEDSAEVVSPLSAWDLDLVQEPGQPTLAASMMPKKTKLQTPHISIDA